MKQKVNSFTDELKWHFGKRFMMKMGFWSRLHINADLVA